MKTSSEIIDAINRLEQCFPVAAWRTDDVDLWPSYRMRLYGNAVNRLLLTQAPPKSLRRLGRVADRAARALWRVPLAAWKDRRANASWCSDTSAVFLSDGVSFTPFDGFWFDRIVDPVMQAMHSRGLHSLKLTPLVEVHVPRHQPSRFVQPTIDCIKLFATRGRPSLGLPQFDVFEQAARAAFGEGEVPTREWLQVQAARLLALARWFGAGLQRSGARCAYVNTYYSLEGQAFVQAARRLGVTSIDLQHGMQGPHHAAYARWLQPPPAGYSTLPDEFWVWGESEATAISRWSAGLATHKPRIVGNYWLQRWADDSDPLVAAYLAQAKALRAGCGTQVLVCLSWGLADDETEKLIKAAKLCGPDVAWWWRMHPVESRKRAEFAARLKLNGLDERQVGAATDLPLYALVRSSDVTVAHSSSVIQEAAELGVPSVVTSDYGAEPHAGLVQTGRALKATEPAAIAAAVRTLASEHRVASCTAVKPCPLLTAIDQVFQLASQSTTHLG